MLFNYSLCVQIDQLVRGLGADFADCYPETRGTVEPFSAALVLKVNP